MRTFAVAAAVFLAAASLAACDSSVDTVDGQAAPVTATTTAAATTAATTAAATTTTPATATSSSAKPPAAKSPCPVTAAVLDKALKNDAAWTDRVPSDTHLTEVTCTGGWATGMSIVKDVDPAGILFKYNTATGAWKPVNMGSGGYCDGFTSVAVATKLGNGC
ncbi:hypothetical protein [Paractinoplanes durhamensis]|uniref:Uncharacterized protein n=1 Tax=Paractinoplanes durhamensis TaxID=113563 RepID=A0ABQ3Z2P5_9ACTN|nr:hypothetical protein [Actinoplanes durhamensis]GIE04098.1 hypothetical protein Adu01nite_54480 [Actinoplanes durhamensis]